MPTPDESAAKRPESEATHTEDVERIVKAAMEIGRHCAALPVLDDRSSDELLGYDECGLPNFTGQDHHRPGG